MAATCGSTESSLAVRLASILDASSEQTLWDGKVNESNFDLTKSESCKIAASFSERVSPAGRESP